MWFTTKIKYDKTMEDGLIKRTNEVYMVEALTFAEAEKRIIQEMEPFISGEFEVAELKKTKLAELFESNDSLADKWFSAKVAFITLDEKTGAEKQTVSPMMVQAIDTSDALKNLQTGMADTMGEWVIKSLTETKVMDVYHEDLSEKQ